MTEVERAKARWDRKDQQDIDSAVAALLQAPNGRRFLWWLLGLGRVGGQPFSSDPTVMAFNCGELNVGNQLMARLTEAEPDAYLAMMKEMYDERNNRDRELAHAADRDRRGDDFVDYAGGDAGGSEGGGTSGPD